MTARARKLIAAIGAAATLMLAAPSFAAWTNPFPLNNFNGDASSPSVGIDAAGKAIIVFREAGGGIFLNTRAPDGRIGNPTPINDQPAGPPFIATNADGASAIVWQQSDGANSRLHLRLRHSDGALTPDEIISQPSTDVFSLEVGIDGDGNAFISWGAPLGGINRTFLRRKNFSSGTLSGIVSISPSTGNFQQPHLAVEPSGEAFVTFVSIDNMSNGTVVGRTRSVNGTVSAPASLSGVGIIDTVSVALDGSGRALVAWRKVIAGVRRVQARTWAKSGAMTPVTTLSSEVSDALDVKATTANVGDTGTVAWRRQRGADIRLESRRVVGNPWLPLEIVSPAGMDALEFSIGMSDNARRSVFLFSTSEDGGAVQRVRARTRGHDGSFSAADIVSVENGLAASSPRLSVSGSGLAAAAWRQQRDNEEGDLI